MKYKMEKQFDLFLDTEIHHGRLVFVTYIIDKVNKLLFPTYNKYVVESIESIKEIIKEYEVENISAYYLRGEMYMWVNDISMNTDYKVIEAYDVRRFRDEMRREKHPSYRNLYRNTKSAFYYEEIMRYELINKEEYHKRDLVRQDHKIEDYDDDFIW